MSGKYCTTENAHLTNGSPWLPGIVEVEFREGIRPAALMQQGRHGTSLNAYSGEPLSSLDPILDHYGHVCSYSCFRISEEEARQAQDSAAAHGYKLPHHHNFLTMCFPPDVDTCAIARELAAHPDIIRAVPVPPALPPSGLPADPLLGNSPLLDRAEPRALENQWYVFRCNADKAWRLATGRNVVAANIDWGFLVTHVDLAANLELQHAFNSADESRNVSQGESINHGTAATGLMAAAANGQGIVGFAFESAVWPIQAGVSGTEAVSREIDAARWARAIDFVRREDSAGRRKVINFEAQTGNLGNFEMIPSVNAAIRHAIAAGVVVCVAAGNGNRDAGLDDQAPRQPIPETGSILVGATAFDPAANPRWSGSNWGSRIVVSAPGDPGNDVTSDISSDASWINNFGGTSGATPKVAGTVALMLSVNPSLTHAEVRAILQSTGGPVVTDPGKPAGVFLDSEAAVRAAIAAGSGHA